MQRTSFTASEDELARIDLLVEEFGFATRSSFLRHAALSYASSDYNEALIGRLTKAVWILEQAHTSNNGSVRGLSLADRKGLVKELYSILRSVSKWCSR